MRILSFGLLAATMLGCGPSTATDAAVDAVADVRTDVTPGIDSIDVPVDVANDVATDVPSDTPAPRPPFLFVSGSSGDITVFAIDSATAALSSRSTTSPGGNPSFLARSPDGRIVIAAAEGTSQIVSFATAPDGGMLREISRVDSAGGGPAHVAIDATGHWALAANYGGGTIASWPLASDGSLGAMADRESPGMNPHEIVFDPSNHYVFVPCLGSDRVAQFVFDASNGQLTANATPSVPTAAGAGPRHLAFAPTGDHAYLINELDSTMTAMRFDGANGTLTPIHTLSTLPTTFTGTNSCAEVHVHPNGRFVYGSNRGHDSIVIFARDASTGRLTLVGHQSTAGQRPRHFDIDPTGAWLFVANQSSDNVVTFAIDGSTGMLTQRAMTRVPAGPSFAGVFAP